MKKYMFLYVGFVPTTPEIRAAWSNWFESIADRIVDSGNPFGAGRVITGSGVAELPLDAEAITGYTLINADSIDEAQEIARSCPSNSGVRVYEALAM